MCFDVSLLSGCVCVFNGSGKRNLMQLRSSSHLIVNPDLFQGHFDGTYGVKMDLASVN